MKEITIKSWQYNDDFYNDFKYYNYDVDGDSRWGQTIPKMHIASMRG